MMSALPPAGNGTTMWTGLAGKACGRTAAGPSRKASASAARRKCIVMGLVEWKGVERNGLGRGLGRTSQSLSLSPNGQENNLLQHHTWADVGRGYSTAMTLEEAVAVACRRIDAHDDNPVFIARFHAEELLARAREVDSLPRTLALWGRTFAVKD